MTVMALLLTAIPLWNLTHKKEKKIALIELAALAKTQVKIDLIFVQPPVQFQVLQFGKIIWENQSPTETAAKEFEIEFPKEGIDLEIKASWPVETKISAVKMTVTPGTLEPIEKSAWGKASLDEVLTFQASK